MKVPSMENQLLNFSSIIARLLDQFEDILDYDIFNDREKTLLINIIWELLLKMNLLNLY